MKKYISWPKESKDGAGLEVTKDTRQGKLQDEFSKFEQPLGSVKHKNTGYPSHAGLAQLKLIFPCGELCHRFPTLSALVRLRCCECVTSRALRKPNLHLGFAPAPCSASAPRRSSQPPRSDLSWNLLGNSGLTPVLFVQQ